MGQKGVLRIKGFLRKGLLYLRIAVSLAILLLFLQITWHFISSLLSSEPGSIIPRDLLYEYNYIKSLLDNPDDKEATTTDGLSGFASSEWPLMTLSLSSYAMRNLTVKDPSLKPEVARYIGKAIERAQKPEYYHFIIDHYGDPFSSLEIKDNAFYLGHFTFMLALYRQVSQDGRYDGLFHRFARAFYQNFKQSPTTCLTSYRGYTWTSEQVVPLRALKIHDEIFGTQYAEVIQKWEEAMLENFIPAASGLMVTVIDRDSGDIFEGERTITNAWTILFLHDILPDYTRTLYTNLKKHMLLYRFGLPGFKEFLGKKQTMTGDTGPVLWGVSAVSTVMGMGSAFVMGDPEIAWPIKYLGDICGLGVNVGHKRKYLLGGRMGTAALFFAESMQLLSPGNQGRISTANILVLLTLQIILLLLSLWSLKVLWRLRR